MSAKIMVRVGRGAEMAAAISYFQPKGWIYLNFGKGSRVCLDRASRSIVKGQGHCAPVLFQEEVDRLCALPLPEEEF